MNPLTVTVVTGTSCHLCQDTEQALAELGPDWELEIRTVDAASPEGWALLSRYRPALLPLVLIEGEVFSIGRLPRKKLRRFLDSRRAAP